MAAGLRVRKYNFCPTNPQTIAILQREAEKLFRQAGADAATGAQAVTAAGPAAADMSAVKAAKKKNAAIYHLWPEKGAERAWCSCPACRAFTPAEQNRLAVNAAADALAKLDPNARLSYYEENLNEESGDTDGESKLSLRKNLFRLSELPLKS
jgi:hypothetical protein